MRRYRLAACAILGAFALSLATAGLSLVWLTSKGGEGLLYTSVVIAALAQLVVVFIVALGTVYRVVLA